MIVLCTATTWYCTTITTCVANRLSVVQDLHVCEFCRAIIHHHWQPPVSLYCVFGSGTLTDGNDSSNGGPRHCGVYYHQD
jgi:hypothetical protein